MNAESFIQPWLAMQAVSRCPSIICSSVASSKKSAATVSSVAGISLTSPATAKQLD